ncbi:MAG: alpha-2-macroglobulin [Chitinophagaceae bacterium]|nr:alpha-2-macroglobulin [Chitinophagaceae bacterium]
MNYNADWKKIETTLQENKNKDAEKLILALLQKTRAAKNSEQTIKALCYLRASQSERDEKAQWNHIIFFEKELNNFSTAPEKQLLANILAKLYKNYYQQFQYQILNRTEIIDNKNKTDIETWTPQDFFDKISFYYNMSILEKEKTSKINISQWNELITPGENTQKLRSNLYDVLINDAIDYYSNTGFQITKPVYVFELDNENFFSNVVDFTKIKFENKDASSEKFMSIKLYQESLKQLLLQNENDALIDMDVKRLKYVLQHSTLQNKEELYLNALNEINEKFPNTEAAAEVNCLIVEKKYNTFVNEKKSLSPIKSSLDEIIKKFPNSEGAAHAKNLLIQLEQKSLTTQIEKAIPVGDNILAHINYKNANTLNYKVVSINEQEYINSKNYDQLEARNSQFIKRKSVTEEEIKLPTENDFLQHSTEIKINSLPTGYYAILFTNGADFNSTKNPISINFIAVTDLAFINASSTYKNGNTLFVLHRKSGMPIENTKVTLWKNDYDYNSRKYKRVKAETLISDKNGKVTLKRYENYENFDVQLEKDNEKYIGLNDIQVYGNEIENNQPVQHHFIFTDRSIYRPGQTIYFKGLVLESSKGGRENIVLKDKKIEVKLIDMNWQEVQKQTFTTNEYGTFNGTFKAPEGLLTGMFQLVSDFGNAEINIEEYKRPKFEIVFDTLKSDFQLNDNIKISAVAKAFTGNNIDGADVKYRVTRKARFPYFWCYYRWGANFSSQEMEIKNGTSKTDINGKFEIEFDAIADKSIDKKSLPFFDFEINADVTDINGETRSGSQIVSVGYQSLILSIDADEQKNFNDFNAFGLKCTNTNQVPQKATVHLEFKKLSSPKRISKKRFWEIPQDYLMTEKEFISAFPDYEYKNENDKENWAVEKTVWTKDVEIDGDYPVYLQKISPDDAWYLIEASTKDKNGEMVLAKHFIRLRNGADPKVLNSETIAVQANKKKVEPNEKVMLNFQSAFDKLFLIENIARTDDEKIEFYTITNGKKNEEISIVENDRGGIMKEYLFVKNNRFYFEVLNIDVPWSNKELQINFETFRDKILPGSEQEWRIKISGTKKEKIMSEVLASMYDASLDALKMHNWDMPNLFPTNGTNTIWQHETFGISPVMNYYNPEYKYSTYNKMYPHLNYFGLDLLNIHFGFSVGEGSNRITRGSRMDMENSASPRVMKTKSLEKAVPLEMNDVSAATESVPPPPPPSPISQESNKVDRDDIIKNKLEKISSKNIQVRTNFNETAFFFPDLKTDAEGNIIFKFKAPESLTKWKMMAFAHTPDLKTGYAEKTTVTQKELMIVPNTPRFFREGDKMVYQVKITNLSEKILNTTAQMELLNAVTNESIENDFQLKNATQKISIAPGKSENVSWNIEIPNGFFHPVIVKTIALADDKSDGEQNIIPVVLNSMLVTETLPLPVRINTEKEFKFQKLIDSKNSNTLRNYALTLEYTSNPAWYAVQALPYLTEYPYECAEQSFNRYYANALASHIANSNPKIKTIFDAWKTKDSDALLSNLQKNEELKSVLLQETPWLLEAKNEEEQKRNIALLFDLNRMQKELKSSLDKIEKLQTPNGGFTWFKGMPDDRFMTQYIVTGLGKLKHLGVNDVENAERINQITSKALAYLKQRLNDDYNELIKYKVDLKKDNLSYLQIQYLYLSSFFKEKNTSTAYQYFDGQAEKYWMTKNKTMQAMIALSKQRNQKTELAKNIVEGLRQNAIHKEEMGMYWKEFKNSYWWYEAPIESQSLMIECFKEVAQNENEVDELKIWLLKQKQTQNWKTTKATADACYALLLNGSNWLSEEPTVEIDLGNEKITSEAIKKQAGTGYFKLHYGPKNVEPEMGNIHVKVSGNKNSGTTWGAVYWQYFENLDKITASETPLSIKKQLYKIVNTDNGEKLELISDGKKLQVGDKIKVRIELRVDREMEYVHMKDMRGACFEPINVLSEYKYQNGLGYYESTKDVATNFFFNYLRTGTYVFEYPMNISNEGDFSNGIATIQCMYAPEFSSHSEGIRVRVDKK